MTESKLSACTHCASGYYGRDGHLKCEWRPLDRITIEQEAIANYRSARFRDLLQIGTDCPGYKPASEAK